MTLREQLTAAIRDQRADLDRQQATHQSEMEKGQARLDALIAARQALTPEIEGVLQALKAVGITIGANA